MEPLSSDPRVRVGNRRRHRTRRGDHKASQAIIRIWMMASEAVRLGYAATDARKPATRETEQARAPAPANPGPARKDLSRFHGVYGDPTQQEPLPRNFFVTESCDGRLKFGAMWGDVAPWTMRSEADAVFVQAWLPEYEKVPVRLEFELGAGGKARAVTHNTEWRKDNPLIRLGDLPAAFAERTCPEKL